MDSIKFSDKVKERVINACGIFSNLDYANRTSIAFRLNELQEQSLSYREIAVYEKELKDYLKNSRLSCLGCEDTPENRLHHLATLYSYACEENLSNNFWRMEYNNIIYRFLGHTYAAIETLFIVLKHVILAIPEIGKGLASFVQFFFNEIIPEIGRGVDFLLKSLIQFLFINPIRSFQDVFERGGVIAIIIIIVRYVFFKKA